MAAKGTYGQLSATQYGNDYQIVIQNPAVSPIKLDELADAPRTIQGTVKDKNGETLIGANVYLRGTAIGTSTDIDGNFKISNIPEGKYAIEVAYTGFESSSKVIEMDNVKGLLANITLNEGGILDEVCLLYTSPSPRDQRGSRMPSSA